MRTDKLLLTLAAAVILAAASPAFAGPEPGDVAPPLTATQAGKWVNTKTPLKLSDYQGKVVALLFLHSSASDMDKFAREYVSLAALNQERGLVVIGVSREREDIVMNWCDEQKITFPIASDKDAWEKNYQISGYPYVYLIDIYGEIAYRGDGNEVARLKPEVEKCLGEVKRIGTKRDQTSKAFDKVWRALDKNDYPNAVKFLAGIDAGSDDTDKLNAAAITNDLKDMAEARLRRAAELEKRFDFLQSEQIVKAVEKSFAGLEASKAAKETLTRFEKSPDIQREIKAQKIYETGRALEAKKEYQKAGEMIDAVTKMVGTHVAPKAQVHINDLIKKHVYRP